MREIKADATLTNPDNMAPDASAVITMQVMVAADAPDSVSVNVAASSDSDVSHPGYQTAVLGIKIIRPETALPVVVTGRSLPITGRPEAAIALLAVTFLAVWGFGIARSQRFASSTRRTPRGLVPGCSGWGATRSQ